MHEYMMKWSRADGIVWDVEYMYVIGDSLDWYVHMTVRIEGG